MVRDQQVRSYLSDFVSWKAFRHTPKMPETSHNKIIYTEKHMQIQLFHSFMPHIAMIYFQASF